MKASKSHVRTVENTQSGTEVQQSGTKWNKVEQSGTVKIARLGKTHQDYWKKRLRKRCFESNGKRVEISDWQVRIAHLGRREWFNTDTPNQIAASVKARDIYLSLLARGWEPTLAKFKPDQVVEKNVATVGQHLDALKVNSALRRVTLATYARKFGTLVAGVFRVKGGKDDNDKFDYVNGGRKKWLERVHRIRLNRITPERIERWKIRYLKEAEQINPLAYNRAKTTLNSVIRGSKALFTAKVVSTAGVKLPTPLPLAGVKNVTVERARYRSTIDPKALLVAAKNELASEQPEPFKIFLLALGTGLRRDEIDTVTWKQIDWQRNVINVETTVHTAAKSNSSEGEVDVDPGLLRILKSYLKPGAGEFVISSPNKPRPQITASYHYRCERHLNHVIRWLRGKGVTARNPIHTLRKEFGSHIAAQAGIFAASLQLRHADIQLTRNTYLDKKTRPFFNVSSAIEDTSQVGQSDDAKGGGNVASPKSAAA